MESAYDRKFEEMKHYIPFLESMIKRLESTSSTTSVNPRQAQLDKIRSLRDLLLDKKKRMKMDNLLKCEQVLVNLYAKVEQKDTFPEIKPSSDIPKEKSDLETVRNKLKSVAKIKDDTPETLPEIARANDVESHYTGSKEPALFQRRPNMTKSPTRLEQDELSSPKKKSPLATQPRRSYTRVLVSPEPSSSRWSTPEKGPESPLFSRRSPPKIISPTSSKKEKRKTSKNTKLRKNKDLNITLNVPEESLHSLNTKDILSRIINCSDGDVDIDTLRELRSQILGELNHTGKTDDISDLILKSYKKKSKGKQSNSKKGRMKEIEEGELSDSESEAIENIYGSLVLVDKDKKSTHDTAIQDKDNQQRKIQICLVINKDEANAENKNDPHGVIDLSEFEMFSDSDGNKSKDIISIDSDTSISSPVKAANVKTTDKGQVKKKNDMPSSVKTPNVKTTDIGQIKKNIHVSSPAKASNVKTTEVKNNAISSPVKNKNSDKVTETINIDDDDRSNENEATESPKIIARKNSLKVANEVQTTNVQTNKVEEALKLITGQGGTSPMKKTNKIVNKSCIQENNSEEKHNAIAQEKVEELPKYTANFYKPIEEQQNKENGNSFVDNDNIFISSTPQPTKVTTLDEPDLTTISKPTPVEESLSKDKRDEQIPLLNEPTVPPKAKTDVLSEIDILQALKNEILSESIAVPGAETATPALHQPKLTKVASAQEVMPKKRISIEKYKEISHKRKPLFLKRKNLRIKENMKKQSLKLTDKECERFNLPKPLSLDDDDDGEDVSDDDFLNDDSESMGLDDIYGDLAPKSPDNEFNEASGESSEPVIIPTDPVKTIATNSRSDVDMRSLLPIMMPQQQAPLPVPPPVPASIISSLGFGAIVPPSPVYGLDKPSEPNIDLNKNTSDIIRPSTVDPRARRDLNSTASPNPYSNTIANTPKLMPLMSLSMSPNINMNPSMTPSRMTNIAPMTPSYMPSIPLLMTPNARSFEMTPSHQTDSDEPSTRQHVYAPSFSMCDSRDREPSVPKEPHWEINKRIDPRSSRRSRFEESSTVAPQWEGRSPRNVTGQPDRYGMNNRRNEDCPSTPTPSFGWRECPPTPGSSFGRQDPPMTPSHPFGRSDYPTTSKRPLLETPMTSTNSFSRLECPTTPSHPFGRGDCPPTPSHQFGRGDCPPTPSHSFGRGDCPPTPTHQFGRSDCPPTPSHQFGRSDVNQFGGSESSNIPKFNKDPRLNRRQSDYESGSYYDMDRNYQNDRNYEYSSSSYKSQNKSYTHDTSRNHDKERSDERYDRRYNREGRQYDRDRREPSRGRSVSRGPEIDRGSRKRESRYDDSHRNYRDVDLGQREKSVGRTSEYRPRSDRARSSSRATSTCRFDRDRNNVFLSEKSDTGKDLIINTSVKSTFLNFFDKGKPIQAFEDHKGNSRSQRAASVGRSLVHDNSVARKTDSISKEYDIFTTNKNRNNKFKRACSMGRELVNTKNEQSFQEVKADLKTYESKFSAFKDSLKKDTERPKPQSKTHEDSSYQDRKISLSSQQYSPRKNYRDPRMRKDNREDIKSKYKIDRRPAAFNRQRSGIIYSNDNIAKGTIMGSGFGVKNYKIPKIKRPVVEPFVEVNTDEKEKKPETSHKIESKNDKNPKEIECDKKAKPKDTEELIKLTDVKTSPQNKLIMQRKDRGVNIKDSDTVDDTVDDTERRVTRSKKKIEDDKSAESVIRNRKSKKAVIYDSESDAENEKDTRNVALIEKSNQKVNEAKKLSSPVKFKEAKNKSNEDILNSTFGIDDMEMFTENIVSDPVIDNINALIADLDNDLDSSKISNDSFTTEMEKMMDTINSPEGNILGDISEVIEKDLNESNEKLQQALISDNNLLIESDKQKNNPCIPQKVNIDTKNVNDNAEQISSKSTEILKDCFVKMSIVEAQLNESINNKVAELAKDSEAIVSTSDIDTDSKTSRDDAVNNEDKSIPDSTINKNIVKSDDGLPDSTNQMHCELSSDVTSTNESSEQSKKEPDSQNSDQNNVFGSIGNLLSILQDKTKIRELLSMLGGNQSGENEKLKKKLEKLSEIVSDEEDENDEPEDKPKDMQKPKAADIEIDEQLVKNTETTKIDTPTEIEIDEQLVRNTETTKIDTLTEKEVSKESILKNAQKEDKLQPPSIKEKHESDIDKADKNTNKTNYKFCTENTNQSDTIPAEIDNGSVETLVSACLETASTDVIDETISEDMETSNMANKEDDEAEDSDTDDAPLIKEKKKLIRNVKGKKLKARPKLGTNKNKNALLVPPNEESNKPKPKRKVKKELQKLQEDIKEMFMTDVLNATGIRMCRLAKMVSEKEDAKKENTPEPVVVLEKVKDLQSKDQAPKVRKKPGPKPKAKVEITALKDKKMEKPKSLPKYKPGPKCRMKHGPEIDPYDFESDSVTDTNTTRGSDDDSVDSDGESLASSHSFGSSEVLTEVKKKPRKKRRGIRGWQSGIIKPKSRKKKDQKLDILGAETAIVKSKKPITIPDLNCFTDKMYCFHKGITTYDCRLCVYSGTDIVNHYKKQHPHTEIPLSRMDPRTAELAIQQCEEINFKAISKIPSEKYICRFCHKEFTNTRVALETFFWHVVSHHTGEFKHLCSECVNVTHCPFNLDIPPPPKDGGQLIGYICGRCNFTQISLENLKAHVIVRHNDEHTEVYIINMAVMSNKAMKAMLRRTETQAPRLLRSSLSNQSATEASVSRDDGSDATESSDRNTDSESGQLAAEENEESDSTPLKPQMQKEVQCKPLDQMKSKITFEVEEPSDDTFIKIEQNEQLDDTVHFDDQDDAEHFDDREDSAHYDDREETPNFVDVPTNTEPTAATFVQEPASKYTSDIVDYPHFKIRYTNTGTKEYVCCINKNDNHYKTPLLISMKKHIQIKHTEQWDGYCCLCKVIVTLQGVQSKFKDCLTHFLDKHMDEFPVIDEETREVIEEPEPEQSLPALSCIPARVATPPVRTASPSYIAVRPLAQLMSKELVKDIEKPTEKDTALPKMENIVRENVIVPPAVSSPVYPTVEPEPVPEKPFSYEEVQAEVMSKKHRVVLDAMMLKENLVRVFKCAGRYCSFTSDSAEVALVHASTHQRVGGDGALNCAYCNYDSCDNGIDLVMHVFKEHSRCQFCCPLCFYRASASQLVGAHYAKAHSGIALKNILRSTAVVATQQSLKAGLLSREVAVQHFVCNHDDGNCNFKTYTPGKFMEHIQMKHSTNTSHPCNLCSSSFPSSSELVVHLRSHGLKLYQCTWCVHGAINEQELLSHAASKHPDRQPQAYIRIITNKDGGAQRVLPLAYLNKSKVPTEEVAPSTNKENPVREAERSIELEKLIQSMFLVEPSPTQTERMQVEEVPEETAEPVEILEENIEPLELPASTINPPGDTDTRSSLEILLAAPHKEPAGNPLGTLQSHKQALLDTINKNLTIGKPTPTERDTPSVEVNDTKVKAEPPELDKDILDSQIICLDSDDEEPAPEETPTNANDNSTETIKNVSTENVATEVGEVSRNSITNEVSLTKITDESAKGAEDASNIIDLSDDDPQTTASLAPPAPEKLSPSEVYKCPSCEVTCKSENGFKRHVKRCTDLHNVRCPHRPCAELVSGMPALLMHYSRVHMKFEVSSRMSYLCGVCRHPFTTAGGAKLHVRVVHKVMQYVVSATKEDGLELFVVSPAADTEPKRTSGRKTSTEILRYGAEAPEQPRPKKAPPQEIQKKYGVDDVDKLPINPILDSEVYCELCEFGTKVRLNMVRHLQLHRQSAPVPRTQPVNPVPHLETNEMHFDKMVNLASSSLARDRAPPASAPSSAPEPAAVAPPESAESSRYPPFVAERLRYTCGARGCAYISVDVAMFKRHWETLHAGLTQYRCVHCPPNQTLDTTVPLSAVRILAHLRMHDAALYACSACSYYHYRRHLIEKHIVEKHAAAGSAAVKVIRAESGPPAAPPPPAGAPTMDLKPWQCGLCKFSSMLRPEVANHCGAHHQSKMQFKCGYCPFRTSAKENVVKHQTNSHPNRVEDVFYYFYREGSIPDEDGVPCWQRQRQKLNLDAEPEVKTEPEVESAPEPPTAPVVPPPPAVDLNIVKSEVAEPDLGSDMSVEDLCKKYGQFCEPDGIKYKCCLCNTVREHLRDAMQCHMYEELNYRRWECAMCSYKAFHKNGLNDHMTSEHGRQYTPPRSLPVDHHIEKWVEEFLNHQTDIIEGNRKNLSEQKIQGERVSVPPPPKVIEPPKPTNISDGELELAFGSFGAPKEHQFCCPKCEYASKDEADMVCHLESELTKIRWGCTVCSNKFQNFHEAQFHCKSAHSWLSARPKEAVRDPSLRAGWVSAVVSNQRQFMKCVEVTPGSGSHLDDFSDASENSLLVARYDEPVNMDELACGPHKRPAPDSDDDRLVIEEPQKKKPNDRKCPYCDYSHATARVVREHMFRHYNMKPYKCSYCPYDGYRVSVVNHIEKQHPFYAKKVINVQLPTTPPPNMNSSKSPETPKPKPSKESDDGMKTVCLYCEKSVPISETESHTHGTEKPEFAKRGEVVIKCCKCLALRLSVMSIQEHFNTCHPNEKCLKYAYFKLQVDSREIQCCGHCYKKFKNLNNLKSHHSAVHASLPFSYTSIPFSHNLHTEGDEVGSNYNKRKAEDSLGPSTKRVARKSTSKLPNSAVAKKSTTKLPYTDPELEEYSYYGTRPQSFEHYKDLTITMPMSNTVVGIKRLSGLLKIDPRVVVKDYKS